jgi:hypothetical protein
MDFASASPLQEPSRSAPSVASRPRCPVCNGPLAETRGMFCCTRCFFHFCAGCEGGAAEPADDP